VRLARQEMGAREYRGGSRPSLGAWAPADVAVPNYNPSLFAPGSLHTFDQLNRNLLEIERLRPPPSLPSTPTITTTTTTHQRRRRPGASNARFIGKQWGAWGTQTLHQPSSTPCGHGARVRLLCTPSLLSE
jgi:hypothetical protein